MPPRTDDDRHHPPHSALLVHLNSTNARSSYPRPSVDIHIRPLPALRTPGEGISFSGCVVAVSYRVEGGDLHSTPRSVVPLPDGWPSLRLVDIHGCLGDVEVRCPCAEGTSHIVGPIQEFDGSTIPNGSNSSVFRSEKRPFNDRSPRSGDVARERFRNLLVNK